MTKAFVTLLAILFSNELINAQDSIKHTVFYGFNQFELQNEQVSDLADWLQNIPDSVLKIVIVGYTDRLGSDAYNLHLSELRAQHVLSFIEQRAQFSYKMSLTDAKGEKFATEVENGNPSDRKVEVIITRFPSQHPNEQTVQKVDLVNVENTAIDRLAKMKEGETLVLENLNFIPGQHFLMPMALPELNKLIQILKDRPSLEIGIHGHICCKLDSMDGLDLNTGTYSLSENRAKYIFDQLILAGIDARRLQYKGFAGSMPLVFPELTEEDRAKNRRVEVKILKN
ncbi:MAG: hypothetical protein RL266_485 [Bacteroidota bacterium]|jgi:outer membrane protein OmpA-like peptidoglycan-associated protein